MQTPLAAPDPFEMLDRIGDINFIALDLRFFQCAIEQATRRPDKRVSLLIFLIPGLFANQDNARFRRSLAENCLCRVLIEIAALAILGRLAKLGQR